MELLTVENLDVHYGGIHALKQVSFTINAGEIVTLIGANGAGKSTTLKMIIGLINPTQGEVKIDGKNYKD